MTVINESIDAYSQQLASSHGPLTPCPPPRSRSKSLKIYGQRATMGDYIFVTRESSVASVSSENIKTSTNSDIVSPSSTHVAKILRADDEGVS